MSRRWPLLVVIVLALAVIGGIWYLRPIAPIATGYAAKTLCSGHFVSGRPAADVEGDLPDNPLVPFLRLDVDESRGFVSASLLGLSPSYAYFTPGRGCSLSSRGRPALDNRPPARGGDPAVQWPVGEAVTISDDGVSRESLEAALDAAFAEDDDPATVRGTRAVVVVHDGRIVAERYAEGFDATTPLLGWSMTKSLTNALVGILVEREVVSLDETNVVAGADDGREDISIEHLLRMTPGLAFDEEYALPSDVTQMLFASDDTSARAAQEPLLHEPGSVWAYSSGTSNILCDALQERTGDRWLDMPRTALFDPLGMSSAVLEPDAAGGLVCSSFSYATARDYARFGLLYLQDGMWEGRRLLPEDWVAYSTTPVEQATETPYGAHWWLNEGPDGRLRLPAMPADAFWAAGNEGQNLVVVPSADVVVVRLGLSSGYESSVDWGMEELVADVVESVD